METQNSLTTGYRAFRAIWDGVNGDKLRELFSNRFEFHNLNGGDEVTDLKELRQRVAGLRAAHPWARLRVENAVGSGSHMAFDWTFGHTIPDGSCMLRLEGGRVVELWELSGVLEG
jgi:hypothetical protein